MIFPFLYVDSIDTMLVELGSLVMFIMVYDGDLDRLTFQFKLNGNFKSNVKKSHFRRKN